MSPHQQHRIDGLKQTLDVLIEKETRLRHQKALSDRAEEKLRLDALIKDTQLEIQQTEADLSRLESNQPAANPFGDIGTLSADRFFGRDTLLRAIYDRLQKGSSVSLQGARQSGKSSVLRKIKADGETHLGIPVLSLDVSIISDETDFFDALCDELALAPMRGNKLHRALQGKRYVLCLDQIEHIASEHFSGLERRALRSLADSADSPLTLLIANYTPLAELFPDTPTDTSPLAGICEIVTMPSLTETEAKAFIEHRLQATGIGFTDADIRELWRDSEGKPFALQQAAKGLYDAKVGNR